MTPLSASTVLAQLGVAERRQTIAVLSDLDDRERTLAREMLEGLDADGKRIEVQGFVDDVRRRSREQAEAEARSRPSGAAWRFAITIMTDDQLEEFRQRVASGEDPNKAANAAMEDRTWRSSDALDETDVEPDDDLDDDTEPKRRKRFIPRVRLRRRAEHETPASVKAHQRSRAATSEKQSKPFFVGGKMFGANDPDRPLGASIDYDRNYESFPPPWLIDDGDNPNEGDDYDVDVETHAVA